MKKSQSSDYFNRLEKGLGIDEEGNITAANNLEVKGTTKLNGGLEPIHTYKIDGVTTLYVYFEYMKYGDFIGYGWIIRTGTPRPCIFHYSLQDGNVIRFRGLSDDTIYDYRNNTFNTFGIAEADNVQAKLFRHKITLNGIYVLMYNSTSNLNVNSVTDLRTIMKIFSTSEEILPVCASDATAMVTLVVTTDLCQVDGIDVTTVSDTVTPL